HHRSGNALACGLVLVARLGKAEAWATPLAWAALGGGAAFGRGRAVRARAREREARSSAREGHGLADRAAVGLGGSGAGGGQGSESWVPGRGSGSRVRFLRRLPSRALRRTDTPPNRVRPVTRMTGASGAGLSSSGMSFPPKIATFEPTTRTPGGTMTSTPPNMQMMLTVTWPRLGTACRKSRVAPPNTHVTFVVSSTSQRPLRSTPPKIATRFG